MSDKPTGIVDHYTLYRTATPLEKNRERRNLARSWRNHPVMIIPMEQASHDLLHENVVPLEATPSIYLARQALNHCNLVSEQKMTRIRAFASVRDEMYGMYRRRSHSSTVAREALRFSEFFTRQVELMRQVPLLDIDYDFHNVDVDDQDQDEDGPSSA